MNRSTQAPTTAVISDPSKPPAVMPRRPRHEASDQRADDPDDDVADEAEPAPFR